MKGRTAAILGLCAIAAIALLSKNKEATDAGSLNEGSERADTGWLAEHGNDPKALSERYQLDGDAACARGADDYLRGLTKYDFDWDEQAKGLLGLKFTEFSTRSMGLGMLTLASNRAKLSNQFGAYEHIDLYCLYNVATGDVVRYETHDPANEQALSSMSEARGVPAPTKKPPSEIVIYSPSQDPEVTSPASPQPVTPTSQLPSATPSPEPDFGEKPTL